MHTIIIIASFTSTPASVTFVASQRRALGKGAARNPPNLPRPSRPPFRFLAPSGAEGQFHSTWIMQRTRELITRVRYSKLGGVRPCPWTRPWGWGGRRPRG